MLLRKEQIKKTFLIFQGTHGARAPTLEKKLSTMSCLFTFVLATRHESRFVLKHLIGNRNKTLSLGRFINKILPFKLATYYTKTWFYRADLKKSIVQPRTGGLIESLGK